jgi:hypothetical protein
MESLPKECINNIMLFMSHPCADIIKPLIQQNNRTMSCDIGLAKKYINDLKISWPNNQRNRTMIKEMKITLHETLIKIEKHDNLFIESNTNDMWINNLRRRTNKFNQMKKENPNYTIEQFVFER